jgi:predicted ATPase/DNA-binding winged helix-turn-helix (wHTH) protein
MTGDDSIHGDLAVAPACAPLAFGAFRLHVDPLRLCRGDAEVRLGGRALDLLLALVSRPGEVLSRGELEAQVWPHSVVEDSSLRVHVAALRRALGDGVDGARYIANVPGRGYSFVAGVSRLGVAAAEPPSPLGDSVNNLPTSLTRLIGRNDIVATLAAELARRRLVSIVGHGGIGKTTLALAVAAQVQRQYPAGVCFVDLAPLTVPSHVIETVATALGLRLPSDSTLSELEAWLRPRRLLLLLDNCEHLLDAVAELVERVLRRAPGLVILTTSREPLDAEGEWVHRLQPLETPPDGPPIDSAGALGFPAVELLAERAAASLDTFAIDADNVHLAAALCRRLDGVPLAIEFAASRIGLLGLQGVCVQLDDRLRLLGSGRRTALPRHRTLRALLDWSYHLLSPPQQEVLRRCGVFKAGFSLEAANAVVADAALPANVVRDCLLDLVAKSLIRVDLAHAPPTYALLEITRAYALEQLADDPQRHAVYRRHAEFMVDLIRRSAAEWSEALPQQWFGAHASHIGNVRAALDWCFGPEGDPAIGIALLATLFYQMVFFLGESEYRMRAKQALDAIEAGVRVDPILEVRITSLFRYIMPGQPSNAPPACMVALAEQEEDGATQLEALYLLHVYSFSGGEYDQSDLYARRGEDIARRYGTPEQLHVRRLRALSLHYGGDHRLAADYASAFLHGDLQPEPLRLAGWLSRRLSMQILMARIHWLQGQGERAAALAAECVHNAQDARFPAPLSQAICLAALPVALWQGDDRRAGDLLLQLDVHLARHPQHYWASWAEQVRQLLRLRAAPAGLAAGMAGTPDAKLLDHLVTFGAWGHHEKAMDRWRQGHVGWTGPELLRIEGELLLRAEDPAAQRAAETAFHAALALAERQQTPAWALRTTNSLARWRIAQDRGAEAQALLTPWLARLDAMGTSRDAADTRALLASL